MTADPFLARVKRYAPGLHQAWHAHDARHLSLVLAGGFQEQAGRADVEVAPGRIGLRPEGLRHAVTFGPQGALVLTFAPPAPHDRVANAVEDPGWSNRLSPDRLRRLIPLVLEGGGDGQDAAWDLIGLIGDDRAPPRADPWLRSVRDRLLEEPGHVRLSDLARQAGRHRVSLGRAFLAAFGESPSVFRRRAMLSRALCLGARGAPAAQAALEAGFTDQSHFSRACRDQLGVAPGRLLRLAT